MSFFLCGFYIFLVGIKGFLAESEPVEATLYFMFSMMELVTTMSASYPLPPVKVYDMESKHRPTFIAYSIKTLVQRPFSCQNSCMQPLLQQIFLAPTGGLIQFYENHKEE